MKDLDSYIKECFMYCPFTGVLAWRKDRPRKHFKSNAGYGAFVAKSAGRKAGSKKKRPHTNYLEVRVSGKKMVVHRIAWFLMTGVWPKYVDHIDHNGLNNRWVNIRNVTKQQNAQNTKVFSTNNSGFTGVHFDKRRLKWKAEIGVNYKNIFLGYFDEKEDAINARKAANASYLFHSNHGRII